MQELTNTSLEWDLPDRLGGPGTGPLFRCAGPWGQLLQVNPSCQGVKHRAPSQDQSQAVFLPRGKSTSEVFPQA